jgi:hypothetical protein
MGLTKWFAVASFVLAAACAQAQDTKVLAPAASLKIGTVKSLVGDVKRVDTTGAHALAVGDAVMRADKLVTGAKSSASLVMRDRTVIVLAPDSQLDLTKFDFNSTTYEGSLLVELAKGSLRMITGLIAKVNPEAVEVKTPTLSVGVRGTDFVVEVSK